MKLVSYRIVYETKKDKAPQTFTVDVSVSKIDGRFTFPRDQVPDFIRETSERLKKFEGFTAKGSRQVYRFEVLTEIEPVLNRAVDEYENSIRDEGSVQMIAYRFYLNGNLTPDLGLTDKGSIDYSDFKYHRDELERTLGLALDWQIVKKTKFKGKIQYYKWTGASFDEDGFHLIDYSEKREKWFEELSNSVRTLMLRVHNFMKTDPETLKLAIDTGKFVAFLGAPEKGDKS